MRREQKNGLANWNNWGKNIDLILNFGVNEMMHQLFPTVTGMTHLDDNMGILVYAC